MAAMMMMIMAAEEEERKKEQIILAYHKREQSIRKNMMLHINENIGKNYGIMLYHTYRVSGVMISDYKILLTSTNIHDINNYLPKIISRLSVNNTYYLIYGVSGIDANLVSYDVIKSSSFPRVDLCVHKFRSRKLATLTGDKQIKSIIYIPMLINYNNYSNTLHGKKKRELKHLLGNIFPRTKIETIRQLLLKEKRGLTNIS